MSKRSPTQETLKVLRKAGFTAGIVEKWNPYAKVRIDLFGFCDIVAMDGNNIYAIQVTSGSNHAARKQKTLAIPAALLWILSGGKIEIRSWTKRKVKRGGKLMRWEERIEELTYSDFRPFQPPGEIHDSPDQVP